MKHSQDQYNPLQNEPEIDPELQEIDQLVKLEIQSQSQNLEQTIPDKLIDRIYTASVIHLNSNDNNIEIDNATEIVYRFNSSNHNHKHETKIWWYRSIAAVIILAVSLGIFFSIQKLITNNKINNPEINTTAKNTPDNIIPDNINQLPDPEIYDPYEYIALDESDYTQDLNLYSDEAFALATSSLRERIISTDLRIDGVDNEDLYYSYSGIDVNVTSMLESQIEKF